MNPRCTYSLGLFFTWHGKHFCLHLSPRQKPCCQMKMRPLVSWLLSGRAVPGKILVVRLSLTEHHGLLEELEDEAALGHLKRRPLHFYDGAVRPVVEALWFQSLPCAPGCRRGPNRKQHLNSPAEGRLKPELRGFGERRHAVFCRATSDRRLHTDIRNKVLAKNCMYPCRHSGTDKTTFGNN